MSSETGFDTRLYRLFPAKREGSDKEAEELERAWQSPRGWKIITAVNNSYLGFWYVVTSFVFFLLAGILALVMRVQLAAPMQEFLHPDTFNQFFTMHGTVMMFLFAIPAVEALAILLLPQMLGTRDLPFPRLTAYAFWSYLLGGLFFFSSLFVGLAPDGGWFMYPPLTSSAWTPGISADLWLLGIGFIEISAIAGAIEIIVAILRTRAPNMTLDRMPMFVWAMLVTAIMIVIAFPAVILCTILLEAERALNWPLFDPTRGGDPLLWQHLFWFFGHPEVYIIFLPAAGLMSMMVAGIARTDLIGYRLNVLALIATGFISFGVWAHHMFATGLPRVSVGYFSAASMAVSLPAGIQVFCWIATLANGRIRWNAAAHFVVGSLAVFVMGGLTGVMLGIVPFDWQVHDTYFVVAHLHYVLLGGMVLPMFAAFYFWAPLVSRKPLSDRIGRWAFWLIFAGIHVTFLPMHLTGLMGMPRRVFTFLPGRNLDTLNLLSTVGAFIIALGVAIFLYDCARNFRFAAQRTNAGKEQGAGTLEWLSQGLYSFRSIPVVHSRAPLWDNPDLAREVEEGRHMLPGTVTGGREILITSPVNAEPQYIQPMPGPSIRPLISAAFTAAFFLSLAIQAYGFAIFCGAGMVFSIVGWLWQTDMPPQTDKADAGGGIVLPFTRTGPGSHSWLALSIVMVVIGTISFLALFSYFYLYGINPDVWTSPPPIGETALILAMNLIAAGLFWGGRRALARKEGHEVGNLPWVLVMIGAAMTAWALYSDITGWLAAGVHPVMSSMGGIIFVILTLQALVVALALLMSVYLAFRKARGLLIGPHSTTMDIVTRFAGFVALQGIVFAAILRLFPGG